MENHQKFLQFLDLNVIKLFYYSILGNRYQKKFESQSKYK